MIVRRFRRIVQALLVLAFVSISNQSAVAQDPITVGASLGILQERIFSNIDKSVDNAFNRFDNSVARIRSQAEGLLDSAKNDLATIQDKVISDLNEQERELWRYYDSALNKLDQRVTHYLRDGKITLLDAGNIVGVQNPLDDETPLVFWAEVDPPLYVHIAPQRRITAYGLNLDHLSNSMVLNGVKGRRASASPTELAFLVDQTDLSKGAKLEFELYEKSWLSFFVDWFDDKKITTPIEYAAVTDQLGELRLVYHTDSFPEIERQWPTAGPISVSCRNNRLGTNNCETGWDRQVVQATAGYAILIDSIKVVSGSNDCRGNTVSAAFSDASGNSFAVHGGAQANSGSRRVCTLHALYRWKERKEVADKVENFGETVPFVRSKFGASLNMPSSGATAIAAEFKPTGSDAFERIAIQTDRWPIKFNAQANTGVVEATW